jgi:hypothetical protein
LFQAQAVQGFEGKEGGLGSGKKDVQHHEAAEGDPSDEDIYGQGLANPNTGMVIQVQGSGLLSQSLAGQNSPPEPELREKLGGGGLNFTRPAPNI